jgi:hypothetical protein
VHNVGFLTLARFYTEREGEHYRLAIEGAAKVNGELSCLEHSPPPAMVKIVVGSGVRDLKKAEEYRRHAEACRTLARHAQNGEHRNQLLVMAETWDGLAVQRERSILVEPKSI